MAPPAPTATKVLVPYVTAVRRLASGNGLRRYHESRGSAVTLTNAKKSHVLGIRAGLTALRLALALALELDLDWIKARSRARARARARGGFGSALVFRVKLTD